MKVYKNSHAMKVKYTCLHLQTVGQKTYVSNL